MTNKQQKSQSATDILTNIPVPQMDFAPGSLTPFAELGIKLQSDLIELWGRRARSWLEWPKAAQGCSSFDELGNAQREFLTKMQSDYARFMECCLEDAMIKQDEYEETEELNQFVEERKAA